MSTGRSRAPGPFLPLAVAAAAFAALVALQQGWIDSPFGQAAPAKAPQAKAKANPDGTRKTPRRPPKPSPAEVGPVAPTVVHDESPPDPAPVAKAGPAKSAARIAYEAEAKALPDRPRPWAELARRCEADGRPDEALDAWRSVLRFDPNHADARKALGYRRSGGAWKTEGMIADEAEQKTADTRWGKALATLHKRMHPGPGKDSAGVAERAMAEWKDIDDVRASASMWEVFGGHRAHHLMLAEKLAALPSPRGSLILAGIAAYTPDPKAGRVAAEALKARDPVEFAGPLIALLGPELIYRVIDVPPGPDGLRMKALEVEDERFAKQFIYFAAPTPADVSSAAFGDCSAMVRWANFGWDDEGKALARAMNRENARISSQMADQQLKSDIEAVKGLNRRIVEQNGKVHAILADTTREDHGLDRDAWNSWLAARMGVKYSPPTRVAKMMIRDFVQPLYQPNFIAVPPTPT